MAVVLLISGVSHLLALDLRSIKFATTNGLSDNTVRKIYQDKRGYIWFATFNGLSRYDGYNIIKYSPLEAKFNTPEFQLRDLMEDSRGFLWILGYNDNVACLNPNTGRYVDFYSPGNSKEHYRYIKEFGDNSIWMWGEAGAKRIIHNNDAISPELLNVENGKLLSDNVFLIEQDYQNRFYISTDKGLNVYKSGTVTCVDNTRLYQWILPSQEATLLIATNGDMVKIDRNDKLSLIGRIDGVMYRNDLPGVYETEGKWYVTSSRGGMEIDKRTFQIKLTPKNLDVVSGKTILDNNGDYWIYNGSGFLYFFDSRKERLIPLRLLPENIINLIDMERYSVTRDNEGRAWITTGVNGLFIFSPEEETFEHISTQGANYQILTTDKLLTSAIDNRGNIWIGSENGGVMMLETNNEGVSVVDFSSSEMGEVGVRMIKKINDGSVLVSTRDGKLYRYNADLSECDVSNRNAVIYDVAVDHHGNYWEATRVEGLILNGKKNVGTNISLSSNDVFTLFADSKGWLWVGTFNSGVDVLVPTDDGTRYSKFNYLNGDYGQRRVRSIIEDTEGYIWIATNTGAYRVNPERMFDKGYSAQLYNIDNGMLRSNEVHCFIEDSQGRIWIGEANNGITILDFNGSENNPNVRHIGTESGLGHNNVQAFVKENDEYIWATTLYGVSRINTHTLNVESFIFMSTPSGNIHVANSAVLLDDMRLLLGTNSGAYTVDLRKIAVDESHIPITVTSFNINGEQIPFIPDGNNIVLKDGVYNIYLSYDKNSLDFEFSTFDFEWPKQTKFRYKVEPLDKVWGHPSVHNNISLKNLEPGSYSLLVEAMGNAGRWDKRIECNIIVSPPWWASWWMKTIYIIFIISGVYIIFHVVQRINELNNKIKVEEQLTDYKLEFFTNISHEFRTPLTLIQISLEKLHDKLQSLKENYPEVSLSGLNVPLLTLDKNSRRMLRLIEELLTFRKVEKNKLVIYPEPTDVIGFLKEIYENFREEAFSKHLEFRFISDCDEFIMNVDRGVLDKIANNLISNALKYTREGGKVDFSIKVEYERKKIIIQVIDNGVGIAKDKKQQLFSRFMQSAMSPNSIGVGLHLTFGLVQLHKGLIYHNDNPSGGSIFTVELPADMLQSGNELQNGIGRPRLDTIFKPEQFVQEVTSDVYNSNDKKQMLIIDDDTDIRSFLSTEFASSFIVLTASDGNSGLEAARNNDVNIIICDVMMPDMSGFEVTRLLKEDFATSHIPIVQLTALNNDDCRIEGVTSGADAYVTKPFNLKYLKVIVAKLIEQRENLFAKFSASPTMAKPQLPMGEKDKDFIDKLTKIVEKQLDNTDYSVDDFAADMAMGRTIFFKKVKGVTGYAPKEYLRVIRMKKAAEMLLTTNLSITEISYRVGISNPAYFNKCFKAQFGKAPSVYQKENTQMSDTDTSGYNDNI